MASRRAAASAWGSEARAVSRASSRSSPSPARALASRSRAGTSMISKLHAIDDRSQIGEARRAAIDLAARLGFDEVARGKIALSVTEAATNILKHAGHGRILLRALSHQRVGGLEVLALDRGPGIADVAASLQDGQSS